MRSAFWTVDMLPVILHFLLHMQDICHGAIALLAEVSWLQSQCISELLAARTAYTFQNLQGHSLMHGLANLSKWRSDF